MEQTTIRILQLILVTTCFTQATALIQSPPLIVKQPPTDEMLLQVAQQVIVKPFIIECKAEGEPAPKYRWIKNGKHFDWQSYGDRISQQPGCGTLVISSSREEDEGQYQCFAENELGTAMSNSVFVRKAELNSFQDSSPITVSVQEGDPTKLTCQPPNGWPKPIIYWIIQNADGAIRSINDSRLTWDPEGNLWFSNVTRNDASEDFSYACAAVSVFRNEYKIGNRAYLYVIATGPASQNSQEPVQQYVSKKNEVAFRGKKVQLYCIFGGTPLPQTVWSKDGQPIHSSDRIIQSNFGKSLIIEHAMFEDQGNYTCVVSNGVGTAKSYSTRLEVLAAPYFTEEPEIINAAEDETVEFRCRASGVPEPEIKWIHNGRPIGDAHPNIRRNVTPNSIIIEKLQKNDTGNYGCNATNYLGYIYRDVYVSVFDSTNKSEENVTKSGDVTDKSEENVAQSGWFIGMMLTIATLLLVLAVFIIKRYRDGKCAVHKRERPHERKSYSEAEGQQQQQQLQQPGVPEYSEPEQEEEEEEQQQQLGVPEYSEPYEDLLPH